MGVINPFSCSISLTRGGGGLNFIFISNFFLFLYFRYDLQNHAKHGAMDACIYVYEWNDISDLCDAWHMTNKMNHPNGVNGRLGR
jgi:hypothetical protein